MSAPTPPVACVGILLALSISSASAGAQTLRFRVDQWTTDDGLPAHSINDITQTAGGDLWVATSGGLARFDGYGFHVLTRTDSGMPSNRAMVLYDGIGDTLWAGLGHGDVIGVVGGRVATVIHLNPPIYGLQQDESGRLVVGSYGLFRVRDGRVDSLAPLQPSMPDPQALLRPRMARDASGAIWVRDDLTGTVFRLSHNHLQAMGPAGDSVLVTRPSTGEVLRVRDRGAFTEVTRTDGTVLFRYRRTSARRIPRLVDRAGRLWVSDGAELLVYRHGSPDPAAVVPVTDDDYITAFIEDRDGDLWAGTDTHGLFRIEQQPFAVVTRAQGVRANEVVHVWRGPDGSVFAADYGSVTYRIVEDGRGFHAVPLGDGITDAELDRRGTLWLSRGDSVRATLEGRRTGDAPIELRTPFGINELVDDPRHPDVVWLKDQGHIYRATMRPASSARITDTWDSPGNTRELFVTAGGVAWAGGESRDGGAWLARIIDAKFRPFTAADGMPSAPIRAIAQDADGVMWIGTYGGGLYRYRDGVFRNVRERDGLAEDVVASILFDDAGNLWMGGNRGVHRVSRAALNAFLDGGTSRVYGIEYGRRDGLKNPETSGQDGARDSAGRFWFPTFDGAAVVDPALAIALDSVPPLVRVDAIDIGDTVLTASDSITLPTGHRRFELRYTAISLRNPEAVRYEYRLDPLDTTWIGARDTRRVSYTNIGPGSYTFRVRAMNAGGVWSTRDAAMVLSVPPLFYETGTFRFLVVLALLSLAYAVYALRVRQLTRRGERLTAIVAERTAALVDEKSRAEEALELVAAQAERLKSLDETKSRFFANVSHEFRTPLSLILGPLEDLRDGRAGSLSDAVKRRLENALANGRRLVRLVDQLLDVAKLQAGAMQLHAEVHDLVPYLRRIVESFASMAERRGIDFRVSCPVGGVLVRFDADQMDKVFTNLLGNAFKFTESGGRVELRARAESGAGAGWAVIDIEDTGCGIPAAHLDKVFDRFHQVDDSPRRTHEGTGIGLALVKDLVELHGGHVAVVSVEGEGSTFTVRLPITAGTPKPTDAPRRDRRDVPPTAEPSAPQMDEHKEDAEDVTTVLVVEDNAELRDYLRDHLEDRYRVIEASNGLDALAVARDRVPDVIVSDVMMPEMDGQSLCEAVKRDREIAFIPVILLTAKASRDSRLAGLEGGADDYLTKPVDVRELLARIANLITARRRLRERFGEQHRQLPTLEVPLKHETLDTGSQRFLRKLYEALAAHIAEDDFDVDALAAALAVSRSTLYRRLETLLGTSAMDVLWNYRLEQAAQWLMETDANVSEVAYGVGFKSVPHFCNKFRDRFGVTPSAYRLAHGAATDA